MMTDGSIVPKVGVNVMLNRLCKEVPDYSNTSSFKVGVDTVTPAWDDTDLDNPVDITTGNLLKQLNNVSFNETDGDVFIQGWLSVTEANGNLLDGFAVFNGDSPNKIITKSKFPSRSKTNTELFKITVRIKLRDKGEYI